MHTAKHYRAATKKSVFLCHAVQHLLTPYFSFSDIAYQCDVISLNYDSSDLPFCAFFTVNFSCLVQHHIHEFIETLQTIKTKKNENSTLIQCKRANSLKKQVTYNDFSLNPQVRVLVQPDLHSCLRLKEFEDQELYIDKIKTMSKNV